MALKEGPLDPSDMDAEDINNLAVKILKEFRTGFAKNLDKLATI